MDVMRRALVIAMSQYEHLQAIESSERVGELARQILGNPDIGGFDVDVLLNSNTSTTINSIYDLFDSATPEDFIIFLFSGRALSQNGRLYLATTETDPDRLRSTSIDPTPLREEIEACWASQLVVILDCEDADDFHWHNPRGRGNRVLILTNDHRFDLLYDRSETFLDHFFNGIESGQADLDDDGLIGIEEAFDHAFNQTFTAGHVWTPQMRASTKGKMVLCPTPKDTASPINQKRIFVSYVHEDIDAVDRLATALRNSGFDVWLDRTHLLPGMRWQMEIRDAIQAGDYFIACFSPRYTGKQTTYMNEELILAAEHLRLMPRSRRWFIPVMLEKCEIPDLPIGPGETLDKVIQYADFSQDWDSAFQSVVRSLSREQSR